MYAPESEVGAKLGFWGWKWGWKWHGNQKLKGDHTLRSSIKHIKI
jgi:hypothetical protein